MKDYIVERRETQRVLYLVSAPDEETAIENWLDGEVVVSEALESEYHSVWEEDA